MPGRVLRPVVVGRHRVVDEGDLHVAVAGLRTRLDRVAAPRGARDDRRLRARLGGVADGRRRGPRADALGRRRHGDEVQLQRAARPLRRTQLQLVGAARPHGIRRVRAGPRVRPMVVPGAERDPRAPRPSTRPHPDLQPEARAALAARAEQVEARRGAQHRGASARVEVAARDGQPEGARRGSATRPCRRNGTGKARRTGRRRHPASRARRRVSDGASKRLTVATPCALARPAGFRAARRRGPSQLQPGGLADVANETASSRTQAR